MKFGLHSVNLHTCGYPENAVRLAGAAEAAGFETRCGWLTMWCCLTRRCRNAPWPPICGCSIPW